jgi:hypothetical protein
MNMRVGLSLVTMCACLITAAAGAQSAPVPLRAPAVPLVAVDPYFSVWSPADKLTDAETVHWTGAQHRLTSTVRVDGVTYRLMGNSDKDLPALEQTALTVMPCVVTYRFEGAGVAVTLSFLTPLLAEDLMILSRPVTYLTWKVSATDGKEHDVTIYYDNRAELAVNNPATERVMCATETFGDIDAMKAGSVEQPVLRMKGDQVRINWGYQYVAVPKSQQGNLAILSAEDDKPIPGREAKEEKAAAKLSVTFPAGKVGAQPVTRWLILAYDDIDSVQFFREPLKAYWKKDGDGIAGLLQKSTAEYDTLQARCDAFDKEFMADLEKAGGPKYAWIGALAYRQSLAASKVVADANGQPLFFCKENTSNGCMGTVDVFYPQAPLPLLISPTLARAMLIPVLEYASSPGWKWPNAPHDVGTWPQGNGQVYGGAQSDGGMPVEETGNMLLLVAAVAQVEGNADFAMKYWPTLTKWAGYLKDKGFDPENQLCTDDFAGHLAHNANLSVKSICALGAFGKLAAMTGDKAVGEEFTKLARQYALEWVKVADDGDHFRLAFDQAGTWSSKYNMVWDKILGMNLFPEEAVRKEMAFYRRNIDTFGLPLDGRKHKAPGERQAYWSKTDWAFWTACLTGNKEDFDAITGPIYEFFNVAEKRVGLTDLYFTDKPDTARMHSRPVIGGIFIKMLYDTEVWKKWASRDKTKANGPWAPLPAPPVAKTVVAPGATEWRYTTEKPSEFWNAPKFKDGKWEKGMGPIGSKGTPGLDVKTEWTTPEIWLRGEITIPEGKYEELQLNLFHDEDAEVFIDGKRAAKATGYSTEYEPTPVSAKTPLEPGKHVFAIHCTQTTGGQRIDLGIVDMVKAPK